MKRVLAGEYCKVVLIARSIFLSCVFVVTKCMSREQDVSRELCTGFCLLRASVVGRFCSMT